LFRFTEAAIDYLGAREFAWLRHSTLSASWIHKVFAWAARVDDVVLGPDVPDRRPLGERLMPAYVVIFGLMFASMRWLPEVAGAFALVGLVTAGLVVILIDERQRRRQYRLTGVNPAILERPDAERGNA
jgi:hypothetical protein